MFGIICFHFGLFEVRVFGLLLQNVKPLPSDIAKALHTVYQRYAEYLDSFESDEVYLKKKVEMELGTKMIHLKMRCSGLGSEWGKVIIYTFKTSVLR